MKRLLLWLLLTACLLNAPCALGAEDLLSLPAMEEPVRAVVSAELKSLLPFDDQRGEMLGRLLSHVSLELGWDRDGEAVYVLVDGQRTAGYRSRSLQGQTLLQASFLPGQTFASSGDPAPLLLGETPELPFSWADPAETAWLGELYDATDALPGLLPEYAEERAVRTVVGRMGTAVSKTTVTVPDADAAVLAERLPAAAGERLAALLTGLRFEGKQRFTILRDEQGAILKLVYSGMCGRGEDGVRKVSLTWTLKRSPQEDRDTLTLTAPARKGKDRDTIKLTRTARTEEAGTSLELAFSHQYVIGGQRTARAVEAELNGGSGDVSGTVKLSDTPPGKDAETRVLTLTPALTDAGELSGTVGFELKSGKRTEAAGTLRLTAAHSDIMPDWQEDQAPVQLDSLSPEALNALRESASQAMAGQLVRALVLLPEEDTLYLSADLDPAVWKTVQNQAEQALESLGGE